MKTQSAKICLNFNFLGGVLWSSQNSKYQDLPKFQSFGSWLLNSNFWKGAGGYSGVVKTQSTKICLNFNFEGGYSGVVKTLSAIDLAKFQLGGMYSGVVKTQSAKICLNFNFWEGVATLK